MEDLDALVEFLLDVEVVIVAEIVVVSTLQLLHQRVLTVEPSHQVVVHLRLQRSGRLFLTRVLSNQIKSNQI